MSIVRTYTLKDRLYNLFHSEENKSINSANTKTFEKVESEDHLNDIVLEENDDQRWYPYGIEYREPGKLIPISIISSFFSIHLFYIFCLD